jgi:hypothetical protein
MTKNVDPEGKVFICKTDHTTGLLLDLIEINLKLRDSLFFLKWEIKAVFQHLCMNLHQCIQCMY